MIGLAAAAAVAWGAVVVPGAVAATGLVAVQQEPWRCPDPAELAADLDGTLAHVRYLADDLLEGREVATRGERCAGDYVASHFEQLGLEPVGDDGTYFQSWNVRTGTAVGEGARFTLEAGSPPGAGVAWTPYGFSASATVQATLVKVAPGSGQQGRPNTQPGAMWVVEGAARPHGPPLDAHRFASDAAAAGASAVVVLLGDHASLPDPSVERRAALSIPVVALTAKAAKDVRAALDAETPPQATVSVQLTPVHGEARNVAALLRGAGVARRSVIVGAHYDHLGFGGPGSLSPDATGVVHNGADDNASGVAVLLELARALSTGPPLAQDVLFLAFTGEERGLWGSAKYVETPLLPLEQTVAMLNLDMVGRVRDDVLAVLGVATAEEWPQLLEDANARTARPLALRLAGDGFGASDHSSFYARGIPVLHFFSNTHAEYHRVEDDWERVNADGMDRVVDLVAAVVRGAAPAAGLAALTPVAGAGNPHGAAAPQDASTARSGFRVRVGTIPDYAHESGGMRITGVRDGSPADKAGLQAGDVIVRFGGREVEDVYGYMYALQDLQPGDEVEAVVLRDGRRLVLAVTVEAGRQE